MCGCGFAGCEGYAAAVVSDPDIPANKCCAGGADTAIAVGEARGIILLTAANAGLPVYGYTPIQVKQAITGTGRANKEQVTYMVQKLLHIEEKPKPDDVADALAIGITGLNFIREQELRERMR